MQDPHEKNDDTDGQPDDGRREFLKRCGRFAAVTPPVMTMMLTAAATPAHAKPSQFPGVGWGVGGNPHDKTPGHHPSPRHH